MNNIEQLNNSLLSLSSSFDGVLFMIRVERLLDGVVAILSATFVINDDVSLISFVFNLQSFDDKVTTSDGVVINDDLFVALDKSAVLSDINDVLIVLLLVYAVT